VGAAGSVTLGTPRAPGSPCAHRPRIGVPWRTPARAQGRLVPQARQAPGFYGDVRYPASRRWIRSY